jgi:hypothetical protein
MMQQNRSGSGPDPFRFNRNFYLLCTCKCKLNGNFGTVRIFETPLRRAFDS